MKILRLQAANLKRLKVVDITPGDDPVVHITGRNGQGKTSVLDSILFALGGKDQIDAVPIRRGEREARVEIDLGETLGVKDWTVVRTWDERQGTVLTVMNKYGQAQERRGDPNKLGPQATIDGLMAKITMDPLAFVRLGQTAPGRREQARQLRGMVDLPFDPEQVASEQKQDYDRRRQVKQECDRLAAELGGAEPIPAGIPEERIDVSALVREMEQAGEDNGKIERQKARHAELLRDADYREASAKDAERQIAEAKRQIAKWEKEVDANRKAKLAMQAEADALQLGKPVDAAVIVQRITDAERANAWVLRRKERRAKEKILDTLNQERAELDLRMKEREGMRLAAFADAKMPVEGLTFSDDGPEWHGLPLEQASGAEQLRVSMAVAMAANPKLRVLRIVDGSLLDEESLELVRQEAAARDFQIWIEGVDTSGQVGFVLQEGEVVSSPASRKAAKQGIKQKTAPHTRAKKGKTAAR